MLRKLRLALAVLTLFGLGGCAVNTPFSGPGYDQRKGVMQEGATDVVVVALTEAMLRDDRAERSAFWTHVSKVETSLSGQPGLIGYSLRTQLLGPRAWTMTVWSDEASLDAFVQGEVHQAAVREGYGALKSTGFARFQVSRAEIPLSWDRALEILAQSERRSD